MKPEVSLLILLKQYMKEIDLIESICLVSRLYFVNKIVCNIWRIFGVEFLECVYIEMTDQWQN